MQKYQGVILAGGTTSGQLLFPLCTQFPKALLPVGNKAAILYQLEMFENAGITDVLIVMTENNIAIQDVISHSKIKIKPEIVIINDLVDENGIKQVMESAQALLQVADRIKKDFILIACDSIADIDLLDVLDYHNAKQSTLTMVVKEENLDKKLGKAPMSCNLDDTYDIMLISQGQLVHIENADDANGELHVDRNLMLKYKQTQIMSNLFDTHIYVCNHSVLIALQTINKQVSNDLLQNFKSDVIPFLVKNQCNIELLKLFKQPKDTGIFASRKQQHYGVYVYQCNNYVRRIYNIKDYQQANFDSLVKGEKSIKVFQGTQNNDIHTYAGAARITPDSMIGQDCHISDKAIIQRSVIGRNCRIEDNVKISNSVIFRNVTIHSGCIIQNCIVSDNTSIGMNCVLDKCYTGVQSLVEQNSKLVDESIE